MAEIKNNINLQKLKDAIEECKPIKLTGKVTQVVLSASANFVTLRRKLLTLRKFLLKLSDFAKAMLC